MNKVKFWKFNQQINIGVYIGVHTNTHTHTPVVASAKRLYCCNAKKAKFKRQTYKKKTHKQSSYSSFKKIKTLTQKKKRKKKL